MILCSGQKGNELFFIPFAQSISLIIRFILLSSFFQLSFFTSPLPPFFISCIQSQIHIKVVSNCLSACCFIYFLVYFPLTSFYHFVWVSWFTAGFLACASSSFISLINHFAPATLSSLLPHSFSSWSLVDIVSTEVWCKNPRNHQIKCRLGIC